MNYRERFNLILHHNQPDRVPLDFCGTTLTACHPDLLSSLAKRLSVNASNDKQATEQIQLALDIDFRRVGNLFQPNSEHLDLSNISNGEFTDPWGIRRRYQGMYWDIVEYPFRDLELSDLLSYRWPSVSGIDPAEIKAISEEAKRLYFDTDYVVVAEHPVFGFFELGCWMFGFDDFLYRLLADTETVDWFFTNYNQYVRDVTELYYSNIGDYIHVTTSGDDFGMQNGPFISPDVFRDLVAPLYKDRIAHTKQFTDAAFFHHSCGSIYKLLDDMIDMGVDILNPVQPGACDMEPEKLKSEFGSRLVYWGAIDEQRLLTMSSPKEVAAETRRIESILNKDGGYVLAASHNIQPDVPVDNIIAMFTAFK